MAAHSSNNSTADEKNKLTLQNALMRVAHALIFQRHPDPLLGDLPLSQFRCLAATFHQEGMKMADIAERLGVKLPALSQVVERLVRRGLLERHSDPDDRRVVRIQLTTTGRESMKAHLNAKNARIAAAVDRLDEVNFQKVLDGLNLLALAAESSADQSEPAKFDNDPYTKRSMQDQLQ